MKYKNDCKSCTDRFLGCHDVCSKYREYKIKMQDEKEWLDSFKVEPTNKSLVFIRKRDRFIKGKGHSCVRY